MSRNSNSPSRNSQIDMVDLAVAWSTMTPVERRHAYRARVLRTDRNWLRRLLKRLRIVGSPSPPSPLRVASRALGLATLVVRAQIEQLSPNQNPNKTWKELRELVSRLSLKREFEHHELMILNRPAGGLKEEQANAAGWRSEGLAILAWALNRLDLPKFDQPVSTPDVLNNLGLPDYESCAMLLSSARLRTSEEIDQYAAQATVLSWRYRTFRMSPIPWDFLGHLRQQPAFREHWLTGLALIDNDLAIDGRPIHEAPDDAVALMERMTLERQIAAYWLQGDHTRYSKVDPSTLLSALS